MSDILLKAMSQYGIKEIPGKENNPEIIKYFDIIQGDQVWTDETAWCSAFINWCAITSGKKASMKLNARSWLKIGQAIQNPKLGDIVVYWRSSPR